MSENNRRRPVRHGRRHPRLRRRPRTPDLRAQRAHRRGPAQHRGVRTAAGGGLLRAHHRRARSTPAGSARDRAQLALSHAARRSHLTRRLIQETGGSAALFVVASAIWLASAMAATRPVLAGLDPGPGRALAGPQRLGAVRPGTGPRRGGAAPGYQTAAPSGPRPAAPRPAAAWPRDVTEGVSPRRWRRPRRAARRGRRAGSSPTGTWRSHRGGPVEGHVQRDHRAPSASSGASAWPAGANVSEEPPSWPPSDSPV